MPNNLHIISNYGFFNGVYDKNQQKASNFFNQYIELLTSGDKNINPAKLSFQMIPLEDKAINYLKSVNEIADSDIKFNFNKNVNNILIPIPDFSEFGKKYRTFSDANKEFNTKNKGKIYKALIPKGENWYSVADVQLGLAEEKIEYEAFEKGKKVKKIKTKIKTVAKSIVPIYDLEIIKDDSDLLLSSDGKKIFKKITTKNQYGMKTPMNEDYYEFSSRLIKNNTSVALGSSVNQDDSLLKITSQKGGVNKNSNKINAFYDSNKNITGKGVMRGSKRSVNTTDVFLTGGNINVILGRKVFEEDEERQTFHLKLSADDENKIESISALTKNEGNIVLSSKFNERTMKNVTKKDIFEQVGVNDEMLKKALIFEDTSVSNNKIISTINDRAFDIYKTQDKKGAYKLANEIITNYQNRVLDIYPFVSDVDENGNTLTVEERIKEFYKFYSENQGSNILLDKAYNKIRGDLSEDIIAHDILSGRLLDSFNQLEKQSQVIGGIENILSPGVAQHHLHYLIPFTQRKGQSADRPKKYIMNINGQEINVSKKIQSFFSHIPEYSHKKYNVSGKEFPEIIDKFGKKIGVKSSDLIDNTSNIGMMAYTYTDAAWLDSSRYDISILTGMVSELDNKDPIVIPYSGLNKSAFGDASDKMISNFLKELEDKKYNFDNLSDENKNIATTLFRNILGEENYNKYKLGFSTHINSKGEQINNIWSDLEDAGKPLTEFQGSIFNNQEEEFVKAKQKFIAGLNNWYNKYFFNADVNSNINIFDSNHLNKGISPIISGTHNAFLNGIQFTEKGISFDFKRVLNVGESEKIMNDTIKSTVQGTSNLLYLKSKNGNKILVEGFINEQFNKEKRAFAPVMITRLLTGSAMSALDGQYNDKNIVTLEEKFNLFKKALSGEFNDDYDILTDEQKKLHNIFELLNIDMEFDSSRKEIIFTDKNTQAAILESQTNDYSSFDSLLIKNINKHWEELYGHKISEEEGRVLGLNFFETIHKNYSKLLERFNPEYAQTHVHFLSEATAYKDTIDANGNVKMVPMGELKSTFLIPTDTGIMSEVKKRKNVGGLKFGPLTKMITNESYNQFIGDYFSRQAVRNAPKNIGDFLFALAPHGSEYARGRKFFQNYSTVGNIIDIKNNNFNYTYHGINNLSIDEFLSLSPIGRMADYNTVEKRLNKNITGIIKNFDEGFMGDLRSFFKTDNLYDLKFTASKAAQFYALDSLIYNSNLTDEGKKELAEKLKTYIKDSNIKFYSIEAKDIPNGKISESRFYKYIESSISEYYDKNKKMMVKFGPFMINNDKISSDLMSGMKTQDVIKNMVFDMAKDFTLKSNLTKEERTELFKMLGKENKLSDNIQDSVKFFSSLLNVQQTLGVSNGDLSKTNSNIFDEDDFTKAFYKFDLNKNIIDKIKTYYLSTFENKDPNVKMINRLLDNVDFIKNGQITNLSEMYDFSFDGTVPFVIDSLSSDVNGKVVPNPFITTYSKIIRTAEELKGLKLVKKLYEDDYLLSSFPIIGTKIFNSDYKLSFNKEEIKKLYRALNPRLFNAFDMYEKNINPDNAKKFGKLFNEITNTILVSNEDIFEINNFSINSIMSELSFKENPFTINFNKKGSKSVKWKDDKFLKSVFDEITLKMKKYREIANDQKTSNIKSSILNNFKKNIIKNDEVSFTNVQSHIINKSFASGFFNYGDFVNAVDKNKELFKHNNNIYADILEVEEFINSSIKNVFESRIRPIQDLENQLISMIGSGNASYEEINEKLLELQNANQKNPIKSLKGFFLNKNKEFGYELEHKIAKKENKLFSLVFKRNKDTTQWIDKDGPLYELGTNVIKSSAAFSPTDSSHITTFMEYEMLEILEKKKNAKTDVDKKAVLQSYEDFKKAIKFTYGDFLPDTELNAFEKIYNGDLKDFDLVKSNVREIKEKLDRYSRIVVGTKETYEKMGLDYLFELEDGRHVQSIKAMISRNPHQYKNSLSHVRLLMLDDEYSNLSFWGKFKGSGIGIDVAQSNLSLIGKKTGLDANADYDGDTMQIVALGKTSGIKDKYFTDLFDRRSEVDYMLRNMTGENIEEIFSELDNRKISPFGFSKNNKYKHLAQRIFYAYGGRFNSKTKMYEFDGKTFNNKSDIKFSHIYNFIEDKYLSMVNEDIRVSRNLSDEIKDHASVPEIGGYYIKQNKKNKIEISRSAVSDFIATVGGKDRLKILGGNFGVDDISEMIKNNKKMLPENKEVLNKILEKQSSKEFLVETLKNIPNDKKSAIIKAAALSSSSYGTGTGIANTGEVHDKFTTYRYVTSFLSSEGYEDDLIDKIKKINGNTISDDYLRRTYKSSTLRNVFFGHDIGTIVEKLAVSAKKGAAASHKRIGDAFRITEGLIRDEDTRNIIVNFDFIGNTNKMLQKEYLKYGSEASEIIEENSLFDNLLNNSFENFFENLFDRNEKLKDINSEIKDLNGNKIKINIFEELQKNFLKMMFSYTDDDIYDVMQIRNTITMREILVKDKGKNLKRYDLINILGNWSAAVGKGTMERDFNVDDITKFEYNKTMKSKKGIYERFSNFVNLFNGKAIGLRTHTSIYGNVTDKDLLEYSEKKAKRDIESYNNKNDMYSDEFEIENVNSLFDEEIIFEKIQNEQYEKEKAYIIDQLESADENLSKANEYLDNIQKSKEKIENEYKFDVTDEEKDAYYSELQEKSNLNDTTETYVDFTKGSSEEVKFKKEEINKLNNKANEILDQNKPNKPSPFVRTGIRQDQSVRAKLPETSQQIETEYPFGIYETDKPFYNQEIQNRLQHNKNDFSKKQLKRELQADLNIPEDAKIGKVNGFIPKERVDIITGTDYDGNAVSGRKKWTRGRPQADIEWEYDGYKYYSQVQIVDGKWRGDIYKLKLDSNVDTVNNAIKDTEQNITNLSKAKKDIEKKSKITVNSVSESISDYSPVQDSEYGFDITSNVTAQNTARSFAGDALTATTDAIDDKKSIISRGINKAKQIFLEEDNKHQDKKNKSKTSKNYKKLTEEEKTIKESKNQEDIVKDSKTKIEEKTKIETPTKKYSNPSESTEPQPSDSSKKNVVDNQTKELKEKINSYKNEIEANKKIIEQQKEEIISSKNEIENIKKQYSKAIDAINENADSKINKLENVNKTSFEKINILEKDISSKDKTIGTLTEDVKSKDTRINNLLEQIEKEKKIHEEQISELEIKHAEEIQNKDKLISDNENKAKKVLEKAQQDYYELGSKEAEDKYSNKIDSLNKSYDDKVENVLKNHSDELNKKQNEISELTNQLNEQKTNYERLVNQNKIDSENASIEINKLKEEYSANISELIKDNKTESKALTKEIKTQLKEESKAEIKAKTDKLKEEHKLKIEKLKEQNKADKKASIEKLKEKQETKIKELKEEFKKDKKASIEKLKENQSAKIKELKEQHKIDVKIKTDDLKEKHKSEIKELKRSKKEAIKKLNDEKNQEIKKIKKALEEEKVKLINALNDKKEIEQTLVNEQNNSKKIQSQLDEEKKAAKELQNKYEQEKTSLIKEHENKINQIEESKRIEIEKISKEKNERISMIQDELEKTKKEKEEVIKKAREYKNKKDQIISEMEDNARKAKKSIDESEEQLKNIKKHVFDVNKKLKDAEETNKNNANKYKEEINKIKKEASENISKLKSQYENKISNLNAQISKLSEENANNSRRSAMTKLAKKAVDSTKTFTANASETVSNHKVFKATTEFASQHKKALAIAGGAAVLAGFFRIFQSNRPVVNLDINEQEYERSQGSVYRNLGQYTMNTNIRSLY